MNNRPTTVQDRIVSVRADPCKTSTLLVTSGAQQLGRYPYAIVERDGFRIGVIGILGQDAATALIGNC